jgi:hypothetical protein
MKRITEPDLVAALKELAVSALKWELLDLGGWSRLGDILVRLPSRHVFIIKCKMGKGALPMPVLQSLYIPPPVPAQAGAASRPLAILITTYVPDELAYAISAGSNILIVYLPPGLPPSAVLMLVVAILNGLENVISGQSQGISGLVSSVNPQPTPGTAVNVAAALGQLGCYRDAMQLYWGPLSELSGRLGWNHPAILELRLQFAVAIASQGLWNDAGREFQAVYEARLATLGQAHPATQFAFSKLAEARQRGG